jgi:flagellin FlaB
MSDNWKRRILKRMGTLLLDQRGITGLETAIVLIAFVVVAAVFAFTVLTTGLFTSEKAKETALAGVAASSATLAVKGSVTATSAMAGPPDTLDMIRIKVSTATGVDSVPFNPAGVLVTYQDSTNAALAQHGVDVAVAGGPPVCTAIAAADATWCIRWSPNANLDNVLDPGEVAEILIVPPAGVEANVQFRIEIIPQVGSVLVLSRRTPLAITAVMNLD